MIEKLLERLDKVKQTQDGHWRSRCPAHDGSSLSLSIRQTTDGAIRIHCFAGCSGPDILAAIGLRLSDLYPQPIAAIHNGRFDHRYVTEKTLAMLDSEVLRVLAACEHPELLNTADRERISIAANRIAKIRQQITYSRGNFNGFIAQMRD